jgi:riboflavin kinase/FMN adenylyltransferase
LKILGLCDKTNSPCTCALGFFDGVHLGHKEVIETAIAESKKLGCLSCTFTFNADLSDSQKTEKGSIYPFKTRLELIGKLGVDIIIAPNFSEFSGISHTDFLNILYNNFNVRVFVCGKDFRYGKNAEGNVKTLAEFCKEKNAELKIVNEKKIGGMTVHSTLIRNALSSGNIELANNMLGREYSLKYEVKHGEHIGSKELYPTINQHLEQNSAPLKFGVYASKTEVDGKTYPSITNIGICPTVKTNAPCTAETYILNENLSLYGKTPEVKLVAFIREEKKFESIDALREQIKKDIAFTSDILKRR